MFKPITFSRNLGSKIIFTLRGDRKICIGEIIAAKNYKLAVKIRETGPLSSVSIDHCIINEILTKVYQDALDGDEVARKQFIEAIPFNCFYTGLRSILDHNLNKNGELVLISSSQLFK